MRKREVESSIKRRARKIENPTSMSLQVENYTNSIIQRNLTPKTIERYVGHLPTFKQYLASNRHSLLCDEIAECDIMNYLALNATKVANKLQLITLLPPSVHFSIISLTATLFPLIQCRKFARVRATKK